MVDLRMFDPADCSPYPSPGLNHRRAIKACGSRCEHIPTRPAEKYPVASIGIEHLVERSSTDNLFVWLAVFRTIRNRARAMRTTSGISFHQSVYVASWSPFRQRPSFRRPRHPRLFSHLCRSCGHQKFDWLSIGMCIVLHTWLHQGQFVPFAEVCWRGD